jgi:LuxR family maltose regulon positive regulatory protein
MGLPTNGHDTPPLRHEAAPERTSTGKRPVQPSSRIVLTSKLQAPPLPHPYLDRPRLSDKLDASLADAIQLTVVSAQAGYGKSVAVAGWLAARRLQAAWLTLEPQESDLARFVHYLVAAIRAIRPAAGASALDYVATGLSSNIEEIGAALANDLAESDEPFVLVLDDYHALDSEAVNRLVAFLITHLPPFVHPVIVGRQESRLPLARLRAHGRLVEIGARDLAYSIEEVAVFLPEATGKPAEADQVALVAQTTEGWAAALHLSAMAIRDGRAGGLEGFAGQRRELFAYLADEVMAALDPDLQEFLKATSVADRLTPELCRELTGWENPSAMIERAMRANLFLVPERSGAESYRYHQLFADYLRANLDEGQRRELHARLARWLESHGAREEAIEHALAAGSQDYALALIEQEARPLFESGELATLLRWLDRLSPERVAASLELASLQAWSLMLVGRIGEGLAVATRTAPAPRGESATLRTARGRVLALLSMLAAVGGSGVVPGGVSSDQLATTALDMLGEDHFFGALTLLGQGMARWSAGDLPGGVHIWQAAREAALRSGQPMAILFSSAGLASGLNDLGRRPEAEEICRATLADFADAHGQPRPITWLVRMTLGLLRYEAGDIREARSELEKGFVSATGGGFGGVLVAWVVEYLALARLAAGSPQAALEVVRSTSGATRSAGMALPSQNAQIEARIRLLSGDLAAAVAWADDARLDAPPGSPAVEQLTFDREVGVARIRIAQGRASEALGGLERARVRAERLGAMADLIEIRVLEAAAQEACGRRALAVTALAAAVRLAAPGEYVRRIVDDATGLQHLLPLVRGESREFVDRLMAEASLTGKAGNLPTAVTLRPTPGHSDAWRGDTLTGRELEVLRLMSRGASDAEIAEGLYVSLATARWHAANIRAKLGARSRTAALARARELGLL